MPRRTVTTTTRDLLPLPSDRDASGRDFGAEELENLAQVLRSGKLNGTFGTFVPRLEREFAARLGVPRAVACASGTAAVHAALGALDLQPGDEVVTSPITDMGAILPILYEGAAPRFADVEPDSGNVSAATIAAVLGERTRAVVVTHLFGMPCDMAPIVALCRERGVVLIEDCSQAFLAEDAGRLVGCHGALATFSLQQGKHMTCGEGGLVVAADEALAKRVELYVNKGFAYGTAQPDHDVPGLNYRMTELQAAVAVAQLHKLDDVVARPRAPAARRCRALEGLAGGATTPARAGTVHSWWRFCLFVDEARIRGGAGALGRSLSAAGLTVMPHYIKKPAFECRVFADRARFGVVREGFANAGVEPPPQASAAHPGVYAALRSMLVLPWNERYHDGHVDLIAAAVHDAVAESRS